VRAQASRSVKFVTPSLAMGGKALVSAASVLMKTSQSPMCESTQICAS
jgi:hypothetical protein